MCGTVGRDARIHLCLHPDSQKVSWAVSFQDAEGHYELWDDWDGDELVGGVWLLARSVGQLIDHLVKSFGEERVVTALELPML